MKIRLSSEEEMSLVRMPATYRECGSSPGGTTVDEDLPCHSPVRWSRAEKLMRLGGEGSGELCRNVPSPALPNACEAEARVAVHSLPLEKRSIRSFPLSQAQRALRFVRMQERGLGQATKRPIFAAAGPG